MDEQEKFVEMMKMEEREN